MCEVQALYKYDCLRANKSHFSYSQSSPCPTTHSLPPPPQYTQEEFYQETVRKVQALYKFDCLRANKSTMAWGVEARVPFLDRNFLDIAMAIDPAEKMIDKANGELPWGS